MFRKLLTPILSAGLGLVILLLPSVVLANSPYLAFSDLVSGPSVGLGDGKGDGVIVTVWGQNLGEVQGDSELLFRDSTGTVSRPYIYYWKQADGELPSGPANLSESHRMVEIAFSVPESPAGLAGILVRTPQGESNELPFTVRPGRIYHVKSSGSNAGDGSFSAPWASLDYALNNASPGATVYAHGVFEGSSRSTRGMFGSSAGASSSKDAQLGFVSYPGTHAMVSAQRAIEPYNVDSVVISKFQIRSSNYVSVDSLGQPQGGVIDSGATFGISTSKYGRAVANRLSDIDGGCSSKYQGAIVGGAQFGNDRVSGFKMLGNEVFDYGCNGSSKLHHTTYFTVRSDPADVVVEPWEIGYNFLHGNKAKFGIHQFDQNEGCGDVNGAIRIYKNVVIDQAGSGISVGSQCGWSMDVEIFGNVLVNTGLAADWDGVNPDSITGPENGGIAIRDSGLLGTMYVLNNLIYRVASDGQTKGGRGCLNFNGSSDNVNVIYINNICYLDRPMDFVGIGYQADSKADNISGVSNIWHKSGEALTSGSGSPGWDANGITSDPLVDVSGASVSISEKSPAASAGVSSWQQRSIASMVGLKANEIRDIYGVKMGSGAISIGPIAIGASTDAGSDIEMPAAPLPPSGISIE